MNAKLTKPAIELTNSGLTDWKYLRELSEEELENSIASDPDSDAPPPSGKSLGSVASILNLTKN